MKILGLEKLNKEERKNLNNILICIEAIKSMNEHYKKTNWLCLKDFYKILKEAEKQVKE